MKKPIIFLFVFLLFISSIFSQSGTTYYISNSGNDSNNGTSESTPWKTLSKISGNDNFNPNDKILLKRGDIWREELEINFHGAINQPITLGAYGSGARPIIDGSESITSEWNETNGNIYETPYIEGEWLVLEKDDTTYWGDKKNNLADVVEPRDFYIDVNENTIYLYNPIPPASEYDISITVRNCIGSDQDYNASNIIIKDIEIRYSYDEGIRLINDDYVTIDNVYVHHLHGPNDTEGQGILLQGSHLKIINNRVDEAGQHGIAIAHHDGIQLITDVLIEGNEVSNCRHTCIDIMNDNGELNGITDVRILRNRVYDKPSIVNDDLDIGIQILGWDSENPGNSGTLNDILIAYNISSYQNGIGFNLNNLCDNVKVFNNVAYQSGSSGFAIEHSGAMHYEIKNNISTTTDGMAALDVTSDNANYIIDNNIWYQGKWGTIFTADGYKTLAEWQTSTDFDDHSYSQDPLFSNVNNRDFSLMSNSIGIDNGVYVNIDSDLKGNPVTDPVDIGAYEYQTEGGALYKLNAKVFLEGGLYIEDLTVYNSNYEMRTDLNSNGYLPTSQPYNTAPWNYNGTESVASIPNSNVVDWVLLEFRNTETNIKTSKAAFILKDGTIVDLDGTSPVEFNSDVADLYLVIRHRNHLDVMSKNKITFSSNGTTSYDFTTGSNKFYGSNPNIQSFDQYWGMLAGDIDGDGDVDMDDVGLIWSNEEANPPLNNTYFLEDVNLDGTYGDYDTDLTETINLNKTSAVPDDSSGGSGGNYTFHLDAKIFLEGGLYIEDLTVYNSNSEMRTDLNSNGYLPTSQPYNTAPWNYNGTESVASIPNSNVVDWVLLEFRNTETNIKASKAAFILKDGTIVDLDGTSPVEFNSDVADLYLVIRHRNHLDVMSKNKITFSSNGTTSYNFTTGSNKFYGSNPNIQSFDQYWGMLAGDIDGDGDVDMDDVGLIWSNEEANPPLNNTYFLEDVNLDGTYGDYDTDLTETINLNKTSAVPDGVYKRAFELANNLLPNKNELFQNYPNPFNPSTNIRFSIAQSSNVKLLVYNILGELKEVLLDKELTQGYYNVYFNGSKLSSGIYIYSLQVGNNFINKKFILLK